MNTSNNLSHCILSIFIVFSSLFGSANNLSACSCGEPPRYFCEVTFPGGTILMIEKINEEITVDSLGYDIVHMKLIRVINGNFTSNTDTVTFVGRSILCNQTFEAFEMGDTAIVSGVRVTFNGTPIYVNNCDYHTLSFSNNEVSGGISKDVLRMSYDEFILNLEECLDMKVNTNDRLQSENITVFPNPATTFLNIEMPTDQTYQIDLYSLDGRRIITSRYGIVGRRNSINIAYLATGTYFLKITFENQYFTKKIVKM